MGNWSMHIEGTGGHDNERPDDAEAMLKDFAAELAKHHAVHSVTFTVGGTRELWNSASVDNSGGTPVHVQPHPAPLKPGKHEYRHR